MSKAFELQIGLYPKMQAFWDDPAQLKILQKGRQTGATIGGVFDIISKAFDRNRYILWLDTNYAMVDTYFNKYWLPVLAKLDKSWWHYDKMLRKMRIMDTTIVFKSYNNPADIEGDNYDLIVVNECGHILKKANLMQETIYPMILTTRGQIVLIGTPKWLGESRPLTEYYYYQLVSGSPANGWKVYKMTYKDNPYQFEDMQALVTSNMNDLAFRQDMLGEFVQGNERVNLWAKPLFLGDELEPRTAITDGQMMLTYTNSGRTRVVLDYVRHNPNALHKLRTSHKLNGTVLGADVIYMRKEPRFDLLIDHLNKCIESRKLVFNAKNDAFLYLNGITEDSDLTILTILLHDLNS